MTLFCWCVGWPLWLTRCELSEGSKEALRDSHNCSDLSKPSCLSCRSGHFPVTKQSSVWAEWWIIQIGGEWAHFRECKGRLATGGPWQMEASQPDATQTRRSIRCHLITHFVDFFQLPASTPLTAAARRHKTHAQIMPLNHTASVTVWLYRWVHKSLVYALKVKLKHSKVSTVIIMFTALSVILPVGSCAGYLKKGLRAVWVQLQTARSYSAAKLHILL